MIAEVVTSLRVTWQEFWICRVRRATDRAYIRWSCRKLRELAGPEMDRFYYILTEATDALEETTRNKPAQRRKS